MPGIALYPTARLFNGTTGIGLAGYKRSRALPQMCWARVSGWSVGSSCGLWQRLRMTAEGI